MKAIDRDWSKNGWGSVLSIPNWTFGDADFEEEVDTVTSAEARLDLENEVNVDSIVMDSLQLIEELNDVDMFIHN